MLEEVGERLEERAARVGMRVAVAGDADHEVPLRERMLRVVAETLGENAMRYAGHGSTFTLSVGHENGAVVLEGADDGIGVAAEHLPRLFERFYRADPARTSRGTGLGLAIVKHIVTSGGGTVEAQRGEGGGLEIRAVFPP